MHEVGMAREIIKIVLDKAQGKKVVSVTVELGDDGHTTPESLAHGFGHVIEGTNAAGAKLKVIKGTGFESRVVELEVEE
ncbi:MAG: hydrogenase/urease maturation nickel metallochaperone HypA [Deltaproteobacteria bacterium]